MKGQSDIQPERFVETQGKFQFRYNMKLIEGDDTESDSDVMIDSRSHWEYDFVNIQDKSRGTIINAVITDRYSYDRQIGKAALASDDPESIAYREYVQSVKDLVDIALAEE